ncbi:MAG TPA: hypothetical protein VML55_03320 [Planctomycetaceae bacterium]|nr:hypothetical protein [Planctomycetaceae bacterium]
MRRVRLLDESIRPPAAHRTGAAALDYVLVLGIMFPLAALVVPTGLRIIRAACDMVSVLISWPFL